MAISGIKEVGIRRDATIPKSKNAKVAINTATGLLIKNFTTGLNHNSVMGKY